MIVHCGFDLHIPDDSDVEHFFRYLLAISMSSWEEMFIQILCLLLIFLFVLFFVAIELYELFIYFGY